MSASASAPLPTPGGGRLMSLDVFRGATIAGMMLVNNPGNWGTVYAPLLHADWHGWTYTDTIFPFFLWIVGVAVPLSIARRLEQGQSRRELFLHALRRALILIALGIFLNSFGYLIDGSLFKKGLGEWLHHYLTNVRLPGVLQRIGICYLIATGIYLMTKLRGQIAWLVGLLAGYWVLMALVPFPVEMDGETHYVRGVLEKNQNFSTWVDSVVLSGPLIGMHVWRSSAPWDPEGLVSTLPAIASCLFGILTGQWLRARRSEAEKTAWLMVGGALLMWLGLLMDLALPINKSIWTSSFAVFMAGLATTCFGVSYWLIDVQGWKKWAQPLAIYGMNAITVFVLSGFLGRIMIEIRVPVSPEKSVALKSWLYQTLFLPLASPMHASLLWAIMWVLFLYLIAWVMYRKKWFVKF